MHKMTNKVLTVAMIAIASSAVISKTEQARAQPVSDTASTAQQREATVTEDTMTLSQSAVLGVVEGITEYLPVSSTGHLILAQRAMGLEESDAANAYAIAIQAGAIAAVLFVYFGRFREILRGILFGEARGRRLAVNLGVAFVPAAIVGLLFNDKIEQYLFGLKPIIAAWFVGGLLILVVARKAKRSAAMGNDIERLSWKQALLIGLIQCLAMWPGTSRSLVTILGGIWVGLRLSSAVEFSFLLGMITLGAATAYTSLNDGAVMLEVYGPTTLVVGFAAAALSAFVAVKWMVAYLNKRGLAVFGYYRIVLAAIVLALVSSGTL